LIDSWAAGVSPTRPIWSCHRLGRSREGTLSVLFRTKPWLTCSQLVRAWASELAESSTSANQVERDLEHFLVEDIVNGRLDEAGPLEQGRRLGLRLITPKGQADYLERDQASRLLLAGSFSFVSGQILIMKEAVLDFARRHELPPPSWWTDASKQTPVIRQTGAPGRPSSMHLVEREYRARADRGDTKVSISAEAKALSDWLRITHPDAPPLTPKTIANRLRHEHHERMRKAQK
jgi:hypothetical protein